MLNSRGQKAKTFSLSLGNYVVRSLERFRNWLPSGHVVERKGKSALQAHFSGSGDRGTTCPLFGYLGTTWLEQSSDLLSFQSLHGNPRRGSVLFVVWC